MRVDIGKIDSIRSELGLSLDNLARKSTISIGTLARIREKGSCRESKAKIIAQTLGVPLEDILPDEEPEKAEEEVKEPKELVKDIDKEPVTNRNQLNEVPDVFAEMLEAVKRYGESQYRKGIEDIGIVFLKALREAIERWEDLNEQ